MKTDLLTAMQNGVIVCDGAMGTELMALGLTPGECGMRWNQDRGDDVTSIHTSYFQAGCRLLTTNTFGGSRSVLARHGFEDHVKEWNFKAAQLARKAVGESGWVLGDVGPFGDFLEPFGDMSTEDLHAIFTEQIEALIAGGADAILVETMSDPAEAAIATKAAKSFSTLPVAVTYAFQKSNGTFRTMMGNTLDEAISIAQLAGADIVGANCGTDLTLDDYFQLAKELVRAAGSTPVILQPNAGTPQNSPNGLQYDASPDDMASAALRLRETGVAIIGGCCGTTPKHLAAMAAALA